MVNLLIQHLNDLHFFVFLFNSVFCVSRKYPSGSPFLNVFNSSNFSNKHTKLPQPRTLDLLRSLFLFLRFGLIFLGILETKERGPDKSPDFNLLDIESNSFLILENDFGIF